MSISVKVKKDSPLHKRIIDAVKDRKEFSKKKMDNFKKQWDDADDSMRAYIHEKEIDKKRRDKKSYSGEVDYITLEVPYTYAIIMTAHTYFSSVMLARQPVFQYTARHGETQDSVNAVEAVVDYQLKVGTMLPVMYNWLYDLAKYSLGIVGIYWDVQDKVIKNYVKEQNSIMGIPLAGERTVLKEEVIRAYEGNRLFNVRPHDFFPDPRVPIWRFQEGEFCIRETSEGYHSILASEHAEPGYYINLKEMMEQVKERGADRETGSSRVELPLQPGEAGKAPGPGFVKITDAYIKLIPSVWGLGNGKRTETWCFQVAEDSIVISAKPLGCCHDMFPFSIMEGNYGSEEFAKFGMLEIIRPLTDVLTWLFNSHFYNVRRVLNNQLIVDPSLVVMKDVTKPGQRVIRLKPTAYGRDVRSAVYQLQQVDVTRSHLNDAQYVEQMIQRVSSVVDNVMGVQHQGGRKTATESRIAAGSSGNRLKTPMEYNSALGMDPLSQMILQNTQQFMSLERKFAVAGNTLETAQKFLMANPQAIAGFYDFVAVDGSMPIDRLAQANFWKELLMQMARVPQMVMEWDISGMIAHAMKLQGERNVDRFRRVQLNLQDPAAIAQAAQAGNVVPLGAGGGRGRTAGQRAGGRGTGTSGGNA